jgi:hypothetical protein
MANTIKIKRGLKTNLPTLEVGEMGYCTDTNELFIGTSTGNVLVNEGTEINELEDINDVEFTDLQEGDTLVYDGNNWVNVSPPPEYGVQWDQDTDTVTRLGDAQTLTAGSDFTELEDTGVWKLRRCMFNDDRTINYYIDPSDPTKIGEVVNTAFTSGANADYTGGDGQVMVEIPKFYWKTVEPSSNVYQWWVSPIEFDSNYEVHPAFITGGQTRDFVYMSAFEGTAATSTGTLRSISGVQPLANRRLDELRNQAQARGTGWQLQTYFTTHALQLLYLIEYADFDTQTTIGRGRVDVAFGDGPLNTGDTISLGNASGSASGTDGEVAISYRGVENFWGNIETWVDGLNIQADYKAYTANEGFESNKFTSPYTLTGTLETASSFGGFVTNILFPEFLPTEVGGSSTSHLHDNHGKNIGNNSALFGGAWNTGFSAGGFNWNLSNNFTTSADSIGSRLQIL